MEEKKSLGPWVLLGLLGLGMLVPKSDDESDTTSTDRKPLSETVFSDDSCYEQSQELYEQYPSVYYSRQEAYDGCRRAGEIMDEVTGQVQRH